MDVDTVANIIVAVFWIGLVIAAYYYLANIIMNHYGIENDAAPIELAVSYTYVTSFPGNFTVKVPLGLSPKMEFRVSTNYSNQYAVSYGFCANKTLWGSVLKAVGDAFGFDVIVAALQLSGVYEKLPGPAQQLIIAYYYGFSPELVKAARFVGDKASSLTSKVVSRIKGNAMIYEELGEDAMLILDRIAVRSAMMYGRLAMKIALNALEKATVVGIFLTGAWSFCTEYLSVLLFEDRRCLYGVHGTTVEQYININEWEFYPNNLFQINTQGNCTIKGSLIKCRINPNNKQDVMAEIILKKEEKLINRKSHQLKIIYNGVETKKFAKIP